MSSVVPERSRIIAHRCTETPFRRSVFHDRFAGGDGGTPATSYSQPLLRRDMVCALSDRNLEVASPSRSADLRATADASAHDANQVITPAKRGSNDMTVSLRGSCCPLPGERHYQKLVFPSNYTHGSGPAIQTLKLSDGRAFFRVAFHFARLHALCHNSNIMRFAVTMSGLSLLTGKPFTNRNQRCHSWLTLANMRPQYKPIRASIVRDHGLVTY